MSKLLNIRPVLYTQAMKTSVDFYVSKLGFSCSNSGDNGDRAILCRDEVELMLTTPNEHIAFERPVFTGSLYLTTTDAGKLWDELKDKVQVVYPLEDFDYGMKEFAVYDNNGYILQFGQEL